MPYESVGDFILRASPAEKEAMAKALANIKPLEPINLVPFFDPELTDKDTIHSYLPVYGELLNKFQDTPFNMMEVGIQRGGSIVGWLKAFPKATVTGVDCQKSVTIQCDRYTELITNAYDDEFIESQKPQSFDFIIDDGSHGYGDILFACENYPKLLKSGGTLVIEDIPEVKWLSKFRAVATAQGCYTEVVDLRHKKNRWDDVMLIIRKSWAGPTGTA